MGSPLSYLMPRETLKRMKLQRTWMASKFRKNIHVQQSWLSGADTLNHWLNHIIIIKTNGNLSYDRRQDIPLPLHGTYTQNHKALTKKLSIARVFLQFFKINSDNPLRPAGS